MAFSALNPAREVAIALNVTAECVQRFQALSDVVAVEYLVNEQHTQNLQADLATATRPRNSGGPPDCLLSRKGFVWVPLSIWRFWLNLDDAVELYGHANSAI